MTKWVYLVVLIGLTVVWSFAGHAVAENHGQKGAEQQATQLQWSNAQGQSFVQVASDKTSARKVEEVVGGGERNYVLSAQMPSQVLATSLIGMTIRNKAEQIGTIRDLILNKNYKLVGFVVDMSGKTGLISKSVGISWGAVKNIDLKKGIVETTVKKSQLQPVHSYATQKELNENK